MKLRNFVVILVFFCINVVVFVVLIFVCIFLCIFLFCKLQLVWYSIFCSPSFAIFSSSQQPAAD